MSEAELHFIRASLIGGQLSKARLIGGQCLRPAAANCRWACPSGWSTTPPARSCSTPIPVCNKPSTTCSPCSPAPARSARPYSNSTPISCCSRCECAPGRTRASWMPLQHWRVLRTLHNPRYVCVHRSTNKNWTRAGILNSHTANDKNERLDQPPTPGDPRLITRQGSPRRKRVHTPSAPGGAL